MNQTNETQHISLTGDKSTTYNQKGKSMPSELKVGLVGVPRGSGFIRAFQTVNETALVAVCDINTQVLNQVGNEHGIKERYTDFEQMAKSDLDVILVSTPMPLHVPQAVIALLEGKHVLSEVPAATDLEQCWHPRQRRQTEREKVHDGGKLHLHEAECVGA